VGLAPFGLYVVSEHEREPSSIRPETTVCNGLLSGDDKELPHHFPLEASVAVFNRPEKLRSGARKATLELPQASGERARQQRLKPVVAASRKTQLPVIGTELPFAQNECQQLVNGVWLR
jgi:hypothetical protein